MKRSRRFFVALVVISIAACGDLEPKPDSSNVATNNTASNNADFDRGGAAAGATCVADLDCARGLVCADGTCLAAPCEFCTADQLCYQDEQAPEGTCTARECTTEDECDPSATCTDGLCL